MQKWEYCAIWGVETVEEQLAGELALASVPPQEASRYLEEYFSTTRYSVWYLSTDVMHVVEPVGGEDGRAALARVITQLGEDGWEMVGATAVMLRGQNLHFKRPIPDTEEPLN